MKTEDRNAPRLNWESIDQHLLARQETRAQQESYASDWIGPTNDPSAPVMSDVDQYRVTAQEWIQQAVEHHKPLGEAQAIEADRAFKERQSNAATRVKLAQALDEKPSEADLALVASESGQVQVDRILSQRSADRQAALSEAKAVVRGHHDGSHVHLYEGDYYGSMFEAERARLSVPQIAQHRAMAEGKPTRVKRWWQK